MLKNKKAQLINERLKKEDTSSFVKTVSIFSSLEYKVGFEKSIINSVGIIPEKIS